MHGYYGSIKEEALTNTDFRRVIYTTKNMQLVLMSIPGGEDIGEETHDLDQFIRVEGGEGAAILDGNARAIGPGSAVLVPAGTRHNIRNTSDIEPLQLSSLYAPPEHRDGVVHPTKPVAERDDEHFDGTTTE